MDEILKTLIIQAPAIAVLLYALARVYDDNRKDHELAEGQRTEQIKALVEVSLKLDTVITLLSKQHQ